MSRYLIFCIFLFSTTHALLVFAEGPSLIDYQKVVKNNIEYNLYTLEDNESGILLMVLHIFNNSKNDFVFTGWGNWSLIIQDDNDKKVTEKMGGGSVPILDKNQIKEIFPQQSKSFVYHIEFDKMKNAQHLRINDEYGFFRQYNLAKGNISLAFKIGKESDFIRRSASHIKEEAFLNHEIEFKAIQLSEASVK